jgi:hypothetical protein
LKGTAGGVALLVCGVAGILLTIDRLTKGTPEYNAALLISVIASGVGLIIAATFLGSKQ